MGIIQKFTVKKYCIMLVQSYIGRVIMVLCIVFQKTLDKRQNIGKTDFFRHCNLILIFVDSENKKQQRPLKCLN